MIAHIHRTRHLALGRSLLSRRLFCSMENGKRMVNGEKKNGEAGPAAFLGHFAGRGLAGAHDNTVVGTTKRKCGIRHIRTDNVSGEEREVLVIGGACSEIFSGKNLADVLRPGLE